MGKNRDKSKAKRPREQSIARPPAELDAILRVIHWNINGIARDDKIDHLAEVLQSENIDVCFLDETHLTLGSNEDLSSLDSFTLYSKERGLGSKKGGGKLIIVRPDLKHSPWEPGLVLHPYLNAERMWLLVYENNKKIAFCTVYCASEVQDENFKQWNTDLLDMIKTEIETIRNDGYECIVLGDLNGHVGCDERGIPGNRPDINFNGGLIRDFVEASSMVIINADQQKCSGVFTRVTANSQTCIDYVLCDSNTTELIDNMIIDVNNETLWGSDHSAILVNVNLGMFVNEIPTLKEQKLKSPTQKTKHRYTKHLDEIIKSKNWENLSIDKCCEQLIECIKTASAALPQPMFNQNSRRSVNNKSIRRLRVRCIMLESNIRERTSVCHSHGIRPNSDGLLQDDIKKAKQLRIQYKDKVADKKRLKRIKLRCSVKIYSKQFWNLVRKAERKSGSLSAIKDENGVLFTNLALVEMIVLEQLALIFSGQRSPVFTNRNEQIIKEAQSRNDKTWKDWIIFEADACEHEEEVCAPVTLAQVQLLINRLKDDRSPGVDGITTSMLKYAGQEALSVITTMFNQMLSQGFVPECLQTGKMTLIDKKQPSLLVTGKRPLTVSSVLLNLFTKIIHQRMDKICEEEGLYGPVQYGFRKGKSTSDCVFVLLAAIRRAKKKNHTISLAFCDIAKAYDSVDRELLYTKLDSVGFGGRVKSIIQSMYYNDCVRVRIGGGLSAPLWFTRGVKQGCVLSPLLFSLYISGLGKVLHSLKEGVGFNGVVVTALFFADDLVLISRTKVRGMNKLLKVVNKFCQDMNMKLAVDKTVILSAGANNTVWKVDNDSPDLVASLVAKYLGVSLSIKGRNLIKAREGKMISSARAFAHTIMGLTRSGLDRAITAHKLWELCAIPSILYASEAMVVSATTIKELDRIQNSVARFILQLPRSASTLAGVLDAGLMPFGQRIHTRQVLFRHDLAIKNGDAIVKEVASVVCNDPTDIWTLQTNATLSKLNIGSLQLVRKGTLRQKLRDLHISENLSRKAALPSLLWMPDPVRWFSLQPHVNDSDEFRTLSMFRAGDAGLGNRRPNVLGGSYKHCPWCKELGATVALNELHVGVVCPGVAFARFAKGITQYMERHVSNSRPIGMIFKDYLGGDGANARTMAARASSLTTVLENWIYLVARL